MISNGQVPVLPDERQPKDATQAYSGYDDWKGWSSDNFMDLGEAERSIFASEFAGIELEKRDVLEIGFGNGQLLAWFRERGAFVHGTEISELGRSLASHHGIDVLDEKLEDYRTMADRFDIIAAFDVLEHLPYEEIDALLDKAAVLLRPGGRLVARFPNGTSPFGLAIQNGDLTHISVLSDARMRQILADRPFAVERSAGSAGAANGSPLKKLVRSLRNLARRGLEGTMRGLYGIEGPLHPNLTMVLRRLPEA